VPQEDTGIALSDEPNTSLTASHYLQGVAQKWAIVRTGFSGTAGVGDMQPPAPYHLVTIDQWTGARRAR